MIGVLECLRSCLRTADLGVYGLATGVVCAEGRDFLAWLAGEKLAVHVLAPTTTPDGVIRVPVGLKNLTSRTLTIYGAQASCNCVLTDQLPLSISPGQTITLVFRVRSDPDARASTGEPSNDEWVVLYVGPDVGTIPVRLPTHAVASSAGHSANATSSRADPGERGKGGS